MNEGGGPTREPACSNQGESKVIAHQQMRSRIIFGVQSLPISFETSRRAFFGCPENALRTF
jgi:hypothetical protein